MVRKRGKKPTNTLGIFCEGEKTEINYFNKLKVAERISRMTIKVNSSDKVTDAVGVVNYAVNFLKNKNDFQKGDLIYCVFDRDSNTEQNLLKATRIAKENEIQITFSNPCFEYWILCHFEYFQTNCEASDLNGKLKTKLGSYKKNDSEIYNKTKQHIETAIKNSKKIRDKHLSENIKLISRKSNPSTQVFEIIEKIQTLK